MSLYVGPCLCRSLSYKHSPDVLTTVLGLEKGVSEGGRGKNRSTWTLTKNVFGVNLPLSLETGPLSLLLRVEGGRTETGEVE